MPSSGPKPTQLPDYEDNADIQKALRLLYYGQETAPADESSIPADSVAGYIVDLQDQVNAINAASGITSSAFDAKGDLLLGKSTSPGWDNLSVGTNGQVLAANSSATLGVEWTSPTSLIASATTSSSGIVQLSDSISTTSSVLAATPTAVKTLAERINPSTKTASYELASSDAGKIIIMNVTSGSSVITIPLQTTGLFVDNTRIDILQIGSVQTSITPASGVTLNSKNSNRKLSGAFSAATLIRISSDNWVLIGDLSA
ncbi:hypothetical protein EB001_08560 [bacterium]|nr:hypothetical protein [bacterium]